MRILSLYPFDLSDKETPEKKNYVDLCSAMVKQKVSLTVIYYFNVEKQQPEGIENTEKFPFKTISFVNYSRTLINKVKTISAYAKDYDFITIYSYFPEVLIPGVFSAYQARKPSHLHFTDLNQEQSGSKYYNYLRKRACKLVDVVTFDSEAEGNFLEEKVKQQRLLRLSFDKNIDELASQLIGFYKSFI